MREVSTRGLLAVREMMVLERMTRNTVEMIVLGMVLGFALGLMLLWVDRFRRG